MFEANIPLEKQLTDIQIEIQKQQVLLHELIWDFVQYEHGRELMDIVSKLESLHEQKGQLRPNWFVEYKIQSAINGLRYGSLSWALKDLFEIKLAGYEFKIEPSTAFEDAETEVNKSIEERFNTNV